MCERTTKLMGAIIFYHISMLHEAVALSLNDGWVLRNSNKSIKIQNVSLPSGIYSELENANLTESILFSYNDVKLREHSYFNWTYSLNFTLTAENLDHEHISLTFHGLDTIAEVFLNNQLLGRADSMFIRYRFDVKRRLVQGTNSVAINFQSPVEFAEKLSAKLAYKIPPECPPTIYNGECHMNLLRKMQASFAWDWGLAAPSMGIWKDVELEIYDSLNIRDVTVELEKLSGPPTVEHTSEGEKVSGENKEEEEEWIVDVKVFVEAGSASSLRKGVLTFALEGVSGPYTRSMTLNTDSRGEAIISVALRAKASDVSLWWPNGFGNQSLYELKVKWEDERANEINHDEKHFSAEKSTRIGFRTIELVQDEMDNGLSFYFRVNGVPIFMKGSNWIPAHILPEKTYEKAKIKELLQAARDAHMNMLRAWGGGVYESDYFYTLADEYGILIWQDMMFACAMYPANEDFLQSVRTELTHQIRRIQHHPSIALFAANNENEVALRQSWYGTQTNYNLFANDYKKLYVDAISGELRKIDSSRPILASSPSNGAWNEDRDDFKLSRNPQNSNYGDIHFYSTNTNSWMARMFRQARFVSEYGFQSFPQGWEDVTRESDSIFDLINHRQHHPLKNSLITYLVQANLAVDFEKLDWEEQVYLSQLSQAMALKAETEVYRSGRGSFMNTMGALYWQLNDVWVAPSWSSIEFNGNFKISHYWMRQVFAPLSIIAHVNSSDVLTIYGVSDEINAMQKPMIVKMSIYKWNSFDMVNTTEWRFNMLPNAVTQVVSLDISKYLNESSLEARECFAMFHLRADGGSGNAIASNFLFPGGFKNLSSVEPNLRFNFTSNSCENEQHRVIIDIKVETPAAFVYITVGHEKIRKHRLSDNGFMLINAGRQLQLSFENPKCQWNFTEKSIKISTLNKYLM